MEWREAGTPSDNAHTPQAGGAPDAPDAPRDGHGAEMPQAPLDESTPQQPASQEGASHETGPAEAAVVGPAADASAPAESLGDGGIQFLSAVQPVAHQHAAGENPNPHSPPIVAELVPDEPASGAKGAVPLPQPNLLWALVLVFILIVAQIAATVVALIAIFVAMGRAPNAANQEMLSIQLVPVATFATLATAVLISLVMFGRRFSRKLALRGCSPFQWFLVFLLLVPQSVIAGEIANAAMEIIRLIDSPFLNSFNDMGWVAAFSRQPWPLVFVGACMFPGAGEEIFFRGMLSRGLIGRYGVIAGALLASFFFGLIHMAPAQACATFVIGLVLQTVFLTTRSLWATIVLHTANNAMAFAMVNNGEMLPIPGYTVEMPGAVTHISPLLVAAALVLSAAVLALLYQTRTRWVTASGEFWSPGFFATETPPESLAARPVNATPNLLLLAGALLGAIAFAGAVAYILAGG